MALQQAQLGQLPSVNIPSARSNYGVTKLHPWQDFGMAVAEKIAPMLIGNSLSRDYADTANANDPAAMTNEQIVDPDTGKMIDSGTPAPQTNPGNAPWWSKIVSGPQMNEKQYGELQTQRGENSRQANSLNTQKDLAALSEKGATSRSHESNVTSALNAELAANTQGQNTLLGYDQLMNQVANQQATRADQMRGSDPERMNAEANMMRAKSVPSGERASAERASVDVLEAYQKYATNYAQNLIPDQALQNANAAQRAREVATTGKATTPPYESKLPPLLTQDQFNKAYLSSRSSFGLPSFDGANTANPTNTPSTSNAPSADQYWLDYIAKERARTNQPNAVPPRR